MRKVWTFDPFHVRETLVGLRATLHRFRAIGREWEEGRCHKKSNYDSHSWAPSQDYVINDASPQLVAAWMCEILSKREKVWNWENSMRVGDISRLRRCTPVRQDIKEIRLDPILRRLLQTSLQKVGFRRLILVLLSPLYESISSAALCLVAHCIRGAFLPGHHKIMITYMYIKYWYRSRFKERVDQ